MGNTKNLEDMSVPASGRDDRGGDGIQATKDRVWLGATRSRSWVR